ncbi:adenine nucleotide alpha hydrolases-like protein [Basidiobolus meristosporus CBS 931.73]|uniref:Adenine nucleotide alpha hydrolases-like protein n=1 Tax=Basidiobolus meristosporus CBS 931.73 TaxID=1314790 RepID=A0A1Y1Z8Z6_9FUNG|nr:adenine nucleotide alpha hydrolases-like protein [Basidiobolus meristosporus CBS 931.73]|eukprot:ORY06739.1 adenine nucleotide alpha hydrolases-like protein [Basidiobolus meristosporus CBS 931.73]
MSKIVIAFDNTKYSRNALSWAIENAYHPGDKVVLLTVGVLSCKFGDLISNTFEDAQYQNSWVNQERQKNAEAEAKKEAEKILEEGLEWLNQHMQKRDMKINCDTVALTGIDPRTRIVDYVSSQDVYMLVLGDRGLNAMQSQILGSVSKHCIHSAPCPVLTVKYHESDEQLQTTTPPQSN